MKVSREAIALFAGTVIGILVVTPFVLAIKYFDLGVSLILAAPALIWLLLRGARRLDRWAHNEGESPPPDPDYPEDAD